MSLAKYKYNYSIIKQKNQSQEQIFTKTAFLTNYVNCPITSGTTFRLVSVDLYIKKYRSLSCGKYK
jgi:hypothetical protein